MAEYAPPRYQARFRGQPVDLTAEVMSANPFPIYAALREEQPVSWVRLRIPQWYTVWLVSRYADVQTVLKDPRFANDPDNAGVKRPWLPDFARPLQRNMLALDGPDHTRLRTLVHKAFTPVTVEQMQARITGITNGLLDKMAAHGEVDLMPAFALPLPLSVIIELLGIPTGDYEKFHRWSKAVLRPHSAWTAPFVFPAMWRFLRYLRRLCVEFKTVPQPGLLSALVQAEEAGERLTEDELIAMAVLLILAGHETTVSLLAVGTLELLQNPDQLALLRSKPELIRVAIEELLRYTCPIKIISPRFVREDLELAGVTLPRGTLVSALLASANRDEQQFPDPDRLDITRENSKTHVAFGNAAHFCIGAPLARMEAQTAFPALLERFPELRLAGPRESLRWRDSVVARNLQALPVRLTKSAAARSGA